MKSIYLLLLLCIAVLTLPVNAVINVTPIQVNQTAIVWQWDGGLTLTALSIDGYTINNADKVAGEFILSDLPAGEKHTIRVYTAMDSGSNTTTTTPANTNYQDLLNAYGAFIVALVCILVGYLIKRSEPSLIAGFIGFVGLGLTAGQLIPEIVYVLTIIIAFGISFESS